ncbi:MAG: hypothetical protein ACFFC7_27545 [Candidatus Hermodarchaeota archaeon]
MDHLLLGEVYYDRPVHGLLGGNEDGLEEREADRLEIGQDEVALEREAFPPLFSE